MSDRFGTTALLHKEIANMSNEQKRHCRIGKVTVKQPPAIYGMPVTARISTQKWWETPPFLNFTTPITAG